MEVSGQVYVPAALPPGERTPSIHSIGGLVNPGIGLEALKKRRILHLLGIESGTSSA